MRLSMKKLAFICLVCVAAIIILLLFVPVTSGPESPDCSERLARFRSRISGCLAMLFADNPLPETDDSFAWLDWLRRFWIENASRSEEEAEGEVRRLAYCFEERASYKAKYPSSYAFNLNLSGMTMEEIMFKFGDVPFLIEVNKNHCSEDGIRYRCILLGKGRVVREPIDGIFQYRLSVPVEK